MIVEITGLPEGMRVDQVHALLKAAVEEYWSVADGKDVNVVEAHER